MTATIHLVRHAEHSHLGGTLTGRLGGVLLTAAGRRQADRLAAHFATAGLTRVQSSPRERAQATAMAIAGAACMEPEIVDAVDEIDFGDWTGRDFADLADDPAWERWNSARATSAAAGGEAMADVQRRAVAHVSRLARACPGTRIAIVSHCDIIRAVVAHYLGLSLDQILSFDVDPASVSTLVVGDWGGRVVGLNADGPRTTTKGS